MADAPQTLAAMIALLADGQSHTLSAQFIRELALSVSRMFEIYTSTSYANDTAAASGGVAVGQIYRNGSLLMVRVA